MRGIIIDPVLSSSHEGYLTIDNKLIKDQFRLALFFWDKIDWPTNSIIHFKENEDLTLLIQENILERTKVNLSFFDGSKQIETLANIQNYVFLKKNIENPAWGLQRYGHSLETILSFQETHKVIELELYNAIPIPHQDVPFEKILEFKLKYSNELIAFRALMDELYRDIINSPDQLKTKQANILRVEESIADLHKAMKGSNMFRSLLSQRVTLKLNDLSEDILDSILRGTSAFGTLMACGADKVTAAIGGVAHAAIKVGITKKKTLPVLPSHLQAYQYISKMEQELL